MHDIPLASLDAGFVNSRYNFLIPVDEEVVLYNSRTGAAIKMSGADTLELATSLVKSIGDWAPDDLPQSLFSTLRDGGFVIPSGTDELQEIRDLFRQAKGWTPLVVTLTTTMDCNLGCYYCYESRSLKRLDAPSIPVIQSWVAERLRRREDKSLHVDWYGGEPTLNLEFIDAASTALQETCLQEGATYSASIISNGTTWPVDVSSFLHRNKIRQVQISFDGMKENHDRRRKYRKGRAPEFGTSSFETCVSLVDELLHHARVDLRVNLDRRNQHELIEFVNFASNRGWFSRKFPAVIQPARLSAYSDRSAFMRNYQMDVDEFEGLREHLRLHSKNTISIEESEVPNGYPFPRTSVCAALATDSFVVGADGLKYRCGLQVGETHRAVGTLHSSGNAFTATDAEWWERFDPTTLENCSRCSFLPICWGGCPKKHLEKDLSALHEQSLYWRKNLPRLVATRFGLVPTQNFEYTQEDQFR